MTQKVIKLKGMALMESFLENNHLEIKNMNQSLIFVKLLEKSSKKVTQYSMKVGTDMSIYGGIKNGD